MLRPRTGLAVLAATALASAGLVAGAAPASAIVLCPDERPRGLTITGTRANEIIHGSAGDAGDDELYGENGDDHLGGDGGLDFVDGGPGANECDAETESTDVYGEFRYFNVGNSWYYGQNCGDPPLL